MPSKLFLTGEEARILGVLQDDLPESAPHLAVVTQLPPTRVEAVVGKLKDRNYVDILDEGVIRLTIAGIAANHLLRIRRDTDVHILDGDSNLVAGDDSETRTIRHD